MLISDALTLSLTQSSLSTELVSSLINTQTTFLFKQTVELEYFARSLLEELLVATLLNDIEHEYEDNLLSKTVTDEIVDDQIREQVCKTVAEVRVKKSEAQRQVALGIWEQVIEKETKNQTLDVVLEMIMEDFVILYSTNVVENITTQAVILDSIFDDLMFSVI